MGHLRFVTLFVLGLVFIFPTAALAIDLQVSLPGIGSSVSGFPQYIEAWYKVLLGAIGVVSTVMIMIGGFQWILAAGNSSTIDSAKTTIISAIAGLLIALGSFTILNIINPRLVSLEVPALTMVEREDIDYSSLKGCSSYKGEKDVTFSKIEEERVCGELYSVIYKATNKKTGIDETVTKDCAGEYCTGKTGPCKKGKSAWVCINDALLCGKTQTGSEGQDIKQCFSFDKTFEEIGSTKICAAQLGHGVAGCVGLDSVQCSKGRDHVPCSECSGIADCVEPESGNVASKNLGETNYSLPPRVTGKNICCASNHKSDIVCSTTSPGADYTLIPCFSYEQDKWCGISYKSGGTVTAAKCGYNNGIPIFMEVCNVLSTPETEHCWQGPPVAY